MLVLTHPVAYIENLVHAEPLGLNSPAFTLQVFSYAKIQTITLRFMNSSPSSKPFCLSAAVL